MYCWIKIPSIQLQSNVLSACNLLHRRRTIGLAAYLQMSKMRVRLRNNQYLYYMDMGTFEDVINFHGKYPYPF